MSHRSSSSRTARRSSTSGTRRATWTTRRSSFRSLAGRYVYRSSCISLPFSQGLEVVAAPSSTARPAAGGFTLFLLLRLGQRPWVAALATAPLLLDTFQLLIEQFVMTETLFELLIVGGRSCSFEGDRSRSPSWRFAGPLLGDAALTRVVTVLLVVPAAWTVASQERDRRAGRRSRARSPRSPSRSVATRSRYHAQHGEHTLIGPNRPLPVRARGGSSTAASCRSPPAERALCPDEPVGNVPPTGLAWSAGLRAVSRPPHERRGTRGRPQARRSASSRPGLRAYRARRRGARLRRHADGDATPRAVRGVWTSAEFPRREQADPVVARVCGGTAGSVRPRLADFLRRYQGIAFTPVRCWPPDCSRTRGRGSGIGRARRSALRQAALLFASLGLALYLGRPSPNSSCRAYTLPALVPTGAGAGGRVTALTGTDVATVTAATRPAERDHCRRTKVRFRLGLFSLAVWRRPGCGRAARPDGGESAAGEALRRGVRARRQAGGDCQRAHADGDLVFAHGARRPGVRRTASR